MTAVRPDGPAPLDHLVWAVPALEPAVDALAARLGVRPSPGGAHAGRGTRNALLALGPRAYLEIIAPDPAQPRPEGRRWFGVDEGAAPRLVAWAAAARDLEARIAHGAEEGVALGPVSSGSRRRPDGVLLAWRFTDPRVVAADGIVPFFIDWGDGPHPAATAAAGATLAELHAEHPDGPRVRRLLDRLGAPLPVLAGAAPALVATLRGPGGAVVLR